MLIGNIHGYDANYHPFDDTVHCKTLIVSAERLLRAYYSPMDRENVQDNLVLRKYEEYITLGCFQIDIVECKLLIKNLNYARSREQN